MSICAALAVGCASNPKARLCEDWEIYVDMIRDYALEPESPDNALHSLTATVEDHESHYRVVFFNENIASYRCEDFAYTGGAHGMTWVNVGTLDRKTGKRLTLDDVFPKAEHKALEEELRRKAIEALGSKKSFIFDTMLTENFCLMEDGWHFVYSPYEIAPYSAGVVEVVIPKKPCTKN